MQAFRRAYRQTILGVLAVLLLSVPTSAHPGSGIVVDAQGQVYFLDTGSGLWRIDTQGGLSHLSPLRNHWLAIDANSTFTQPRVPTDSGRDWVITAVGTSPTLLISTDFPLVVGSDGNLYYPSARETNVRILRTDRNRATSTLLTLPRSVAGASLGWINGIATGPDGSIYYSEDNAVRRIAADRRVSTIGVVSSLADRAQIPGVEKRPYLRGLKVDAKGMVYVADSGDGRVLKIAPDGKISTLLQLESPWSPTDVAIFGDVVYVLEFLHAPGDDRLVWMPRVRKITPDGNSTVIVTVDKMPGARPARPAATVTSEPAAYSVFSVEFWALLFKSFPIS